MNRVVLDTNILVSAFATPQGVPGCIFDAWLSGKFELVISPYILYELYTIAVQKLHFPPHEVHAALQYFYHAACLVEPLWVPSLQNVAENDLPILGTALAGVAQGIVTGDEALLRLGTYQGIRILRPRAFFDIISKRDT